MRETSEEKYQNDQIVTVSDALHAMCQPLTALQCRLEIAEQGGASEEVLTLLRESLQQCARLAESISVMREAVQNCYRGR